MKMQNKAPLAIGAILLLSSVIASTFMLDHEKESSNYAWNSYTKSVDMSQNTKMETIITKVESPYDEGVAGVGNAGMNVSLPGLSQSSPDWLTVVDKVHKAYGAAGFKYVYGGTGTITYNGKTDTVRTDCSGYVGYCMYVYGIADNPIPISSQDDLTPFGCVEVPVSDLQSGDIVVYPSHIEVWYQDPMVVYNWGGTSSAEGKYIGVTDVSTVTSYGNSSRKRSAITRVWRVPTISNSSSPTINVIPPGETGDAIVYLNAGHGCQYVKDKNEHKVYGFTSAGAPGERDFNLDIVSRIKDNLAGTGIIVKESTDITFNGETGSDYDWGNKYRSLAYGQSDCTLFVQIHYDGNGDPNYNGAHVITNEHPNAKSIGSIIVNNYEQEVGIAVNHTKNTIPGVDDTRVDEFALFTAIGNSKPMIMVECGVNSNASDSSLLHDSATRDKIAKKISDAIKAYYGK